MPSIIFVTGVAGFIGSAPVRRLIAESDDVGALRELVAPWRPGVVAHLGNA